MARSEVDLRVRARRAYELGRVAAGVRGLWPLALLVPLSLATRAGARAPSTLSVAVLVLAVALVCGWRGGPLARGASAGWIAGLPPLLLPMVVVARLSPCADCDLMGPGLAAERWPECLVACGVGGLCAGVLVGLRAEQGAGRGRFVGAAALVASLTGLLGCSLVGASGALGIVAGVALGAAPTLLIGRAARAS